MNKSDHITHQSSRKEETTTLLPRWMMADPLKVLLSKEAAEIKRSCAGCVNAKSVVSPFGETVTRCLKGRPYGKKCQQYGRPDESGR